MEDSDEGEKETVKTIFVGNLPYSTSEEELRELFEKHGAVQSARLVIDKETGRSRGFGFVEMNDEEAKAAIEKLNGTDIGGRSLRVNEAQERGSGRRPMC